MVAHATPQPIANPGQPEGPAPLGQDLGTVHSSPFVLEVPGATDTQYDPLSSQAAADRAASLAQLRSEGPTVVANPNLSYAKLAGRGGNIIGSQDPREMLAARGAQTDAVKSTVGAEVAPPEVSDAVERPKLLGRVRRYLGKKAVAATLVGVTKLTSTFMGDPADQPTVEAPPPSDIPAVVAPAPKTEFLTADQAGVAPGYDAFVASRSAGSTESFTPPVQADSPETHEPTLATQGGAANVADFANAVKAQLTQGTEAALPADAPPSMEPTAYPGANADDLVGRR